MTLHPSSKDCEDKEQSVVDQLELVVYAPNPQFGTVCLCVEPCQCASDEKQHLTHAWELTCSIHSLTEVMTLVVLRLHSWLPLK